MRSKIKKLPRQFQKVLEVCSQIAASRKFKLYLVGGVVRDLILCRSVFDLDIVVEGRAIELAADLARHLDVEFRKHHVFGTATVYWQGHKIDFATARREHYAHPGALPRVKASTLKDDCLRRDFTINSMAISLNKEDYGELIDYCRGREDLSKGLVRVLHPRSFVDDPTRILRAIRFEQRFGFKLEKDTAYRLKEALAADAFLSVNPHRLRDELILILEEPRPRRYLRRINNLSGFYFLGIKNYGFMRKGDLALAARIQKALGFWQKKFPGRHALREWLVYLGAILINRKKEEIAGFINRFGFRKGERLCIMSLKEELASIKRLDKPSRANTIYRLLNSLSFESLVFFYAYYPSRRIRRKIVFFVEKLLGLEIKVKADDLNSAGIKPANIYGKVMRRLLYAKMHRPLNSKRDELRQAKIIFRRMNK